MDETKRQWLTNQKKRIERRLLPAQGGREPRGEGPELAARSIHYEVSQRASAIACGGIGAIHMLAREVGLIDALHTRLPILKRRRPYSEADHVLNIAHDPRPDHRRRLLPTRASACGSGSRSRRDPRRVHGTWGYHPLLITLANTGEPLYIMNRSGNRPSHEGAAAYLDRAVALARRAGWKDVLLRGDTDFWQTAYIDRWDEDGVRFVFGYDARRAMVARAEDIEREEYCALVRKADAFFDGEARAKQPRVKEEIVRERGYRTMRLVREDVAERSRAELRCGRP